MLRMATSVRSLFPFFQLRARSRKVDTGFRENGPKFWMNLQAHYDLKTARRNLKPKECHAHQITAGRMNRPPGPAASGGRTNIDLDLQARTGRHGWKRA